MLKNRDSHTESSFPSKISICEYHTQLPILLDKLTILSITIEAGASVTC